MCHYKLSAIWGCDVSLHFLKCLMKYVYNHAPDIRVNIFSLQIVELKAVIYLEVKAFILAHHAKVFFSRMDT